MPRSRDTVNLPSNRPTKPRPKSSSSYNDGAVGLGIVAAMSSAAANSKLIAARPRSEPVPIVSPRPMRAGWGNDGEAEEDDEELLESYTCVISHVAGSAVRKRVYFDDGSHGVRRNYGASPESPAAMKTADLMNRCYLCSKKLRGLDIIIYSGDKAFCSPECRSRQILNKENNNVSPCSVPTSSLRVL